MAAQNRSRPATRRHVVLVPGFAGFDALGQLEYYSGITLLFHGERDGDAVLHYFDNIPTAGIATRAAKLRAYLAKRIARGEISINDEVSLVGHSTGGLDIRWLLWDLHSGRKETTVVDGGVEVGPRRILECVRRVVFLSVPHWGTNLADWARAHGVAREAVVAKLRTAVAGSQVPLLSRLEEWVTAGAASLTGAGLLRAVQDALTEADEYYGERSPERMVQCHEAAAALALYLRQIAWDFSAIDDLTSRPGSGEPTSPAHFSLRTRLAERRMWSDRQIETLSYATIGRRPFRFNLDSPAPAWELTKPWTYPEVMKDAALCAGTDIVYRATYRACAGGPLEWPALGGEIHRRLGEWRKQQIALWDNDGIVNTASMLWPDGENVLVSCDHMDIVGHHRAIEAGPGLGRRYRAYDLLSSGSVFSDRIFERVWKEIFAFCSRKAVVGRAAAASSR